MNDDLRDVFRRLAGEAPSDDGLLAGVHAASTRAAVRRKVLVASAAALALLVGGIGVVSQTGSVPRSHEQLIVDTSDTPSPLVSSSTSASPTPQPSVAGTSAASDSYHGRAVAPDGEPIANLYVYVIPRFRNSWFRTQPVARTAADGTFDIDCPQGAVLLSPYAIGRPIPFDAPNWRGTYVGGGFLLTEAERPTCTDARRTTTVPEGAVIYGALRGPADCRVQTWAVLAGSDANPPGHIGYDQQWLRVVVAPGAAFRLAGLPPGQYTVVAREEAPEDPIPLRESTSEKVTVDGPGRYEAVLDLRAVDCATGQATPSPSTTAVPSASSQPTATPTPEPTTTPST